ncbi:hypothetical protein [Aquimarina aggregata]|uniref:hypothetical protein n=1 Tax=Aquimarina aggregata TaxID=1642818 RepID=UPI002490F1DB|nr:hypothetical protein [Aquimarina aggregata]
MMNIYDIPNNYPIGCSDDHINEILELCQKEIIKYNNPDVQKGSTYYSQLAEQGNTELNRRLTERLISNLRESSKMQRQLTKAIIWIGGFNLLIGAIAVGFKLYDLFN